MCNRASLSSYKLSLTHKTIISYAVQGALCARAKCASLGQEQPGSTGKDVQGGTPQEQSYTASIILKQLLPVSRGYSSMIWEPHL